MKHSIEEIRIALYLGIPHLDDYDMSRPEVVEFVEYCTRKRLRNPVRTKSYCCHQIEDSGQERLDSLERVLKNLERDLGNPSTYLFYFKPQSSSLPLRASEADLNPIYKSLFGRDLNNS